MNCSVSIEVRPPGGWDFEENRVHVNYLMVLRNSILKRKGKCPLIDNEIEKFYNSIGQKWIKK